MKFKEKPSNRKVEKSSLVEGLKKKFGKDFLIALASFVAFSSLLTQKSEAQNNLKQAIYNEVKIDSTVQEEFEKQREFYINWFSKRIIFDNNLQKEFEKIQPNILENLKKVALKQDTVSLFNQEKIQGIAMNNNDTVFVDLKKLNEKNRHTGIVHELGHQAFPQKNNENQMPEWMVNLIKEALEPIENLKIINPDSTIAKQITYLQDPDEVYARICVLREKYGFVPFRLVEEDDLTEIYLKNSSKTQGGPENWNVNQLLGIIQRDKLVDLLNKLP